jgi:hypothetical protein
MAICPLRAPGLCGPDRGAENAGKLAILLDEAGKPGIRNHT